MAAMADEVNSMLMKETWSLVDRSKARKVICSRFVLCNKYGTNGVLKKRKARIVAKGYSEQYCKDFHETYAPVARLSSIRTTIAFAAQNDMNIRQYDVATAYLNAELDEQVFMEVPDWMENVLEHIISEKRNQDQLFNKAKTMLNELTQGNKVCLMRKALYIAHAASSLSQFNDCFNKTHWNAAKRTLRYLKGTDDYGILYRRGKSLLVGYVDAD